MLSESRPITGGNLSDKIFSTNPMSWSEVITPRMKKVVENLLVVVSSNGDTVIVNGGEKIGLDNFVKYPTAYVNEKTRNGVICIFNPHLTPDGNIDLG